LIQWNDIGFQYFLPCFVRIDVQNQAVDICQCG
jgi:hypothetical protein